MEKAHVRILDLLFAQTGELQSQRKQVESLESKLEGLPEEQKIQARRELEKTLDELCKLESENSKLMTRWYMLCLLGQIDNLEDAGSLSSELQEEINGTRARIQSVDERLESERPLDFFSLVFDLLEIGKRLPVLSGIIGQNIDAAAAVGLPDYTSIRDLLHRQKCSTGGRTKAEREREAKMEAIRPLLEVLPKLRFSGKCKTCAEAVSRLLNEKRFEAIAELVYADHPKISFEKFLMPEAKKIWRECVKRHSSPHIT